MTNYRISDANIKDIAAMYSVHYTVYLCLFWGQNNVLHWKVSIIQLHWKRRKFEETYRAFCVQWYIDLGILSYKCNRYTEAGIYLQQHKETYHDHYIVRLNE